MFVNNIHEDVYEQGDTYWSFTTIKFNEIINILYMLKFTKLLTHTWTHIKPWIIRLFDTH